MVLKYFLFGSAFLFASCTLVNGETPSDYNNKPHRRGGSPSSSSSAVLSSSSVSLNSSSSAAVSSSSVAVMGSSSSVVQSSSSVVVSSSSAIVPSSSSTLPSSSSVQVVQPGVIYGTPVTYEGETYQTVVIGGQTWMARNLNYNASGSKCGNGSSLNDENTSTCDTYGRLYDWATANTVCPSGWHLPSRNEWTMLSDFAGGIYNSDAAKKLRATSGWDDNYQNSGTDNYGFAALPGGGGKPDGLHYDHAGDNCNWWSTTVVSGNHAYYLGIIISESSELVYEDSEAIKSTFYSVRCLKD